MASFRLAADAIEWQKIGSSPPHPSFLGTIAKGFDQEDYASLRRRDKQRTMKRKNRRIRELEQIETELDNEIFAAENSSEYDRSSWDTKELHQLYPNLMNPVNIH